MSFIELSVLQLHIISRRFISQGLHNNLLHIQFIISVIGFIDQQDCQHPLCSVIYRWVRVQIVDITHNITIIVSHKYYFEYINSCIAVQQKLKQQCYKCSGYCQLVIVLNITMQQQWNQPEAITQTVTWLQKAIGVWQVIQHRIMSLYP